MIDQPGEEGIAGNRFEARQLAIYTGEKSIRSFRSRSSDQLAVRLCDRTLHIPVAELPAGQQRGDTFEIGCAPRSRDRLRCVPDLGKLLVSKRHQLHSVSASFHCPGGFITPALCM